MLCLWCSYNTPEVLFITYFMQVCLALTFITLLKVWCQRATFVPRHSCLVRALDSWLWIPIHCVVFLVCSHVMFISHWVKVCMSHYLGVQDFVCVFVLDMETLCTLFCPPHVLDSPYIRHFASFWWWWWLHRNAASSIVDAVHSTQLRRHPFLKWYSRAW